MMTRTAGGDGMMKINYPGSTANTAVQTVTESRMVHAVYRHGARLDLAPMWLCGAGAGGRALSERSLPYQLRSPFSACRSLPEMRSFTLVACSLRGRVSLSAVLAAAFYGFPPSPPASIRVSGCTGASGSLVSVLAQNLGPV